MTGYNGAGSPEICTRPQLAAAAACGDCTVSSTAPPAPPGSPELCSASPAHYQYSRSPP